MEDWKKRYIHEKDVRDSQLESLDLPPVVDPKFGTLKKGPANMWIRFEGKKFWELMNAKNHTSCLFEDCKCSKAKTND